MVNITLGILNYIKLSMCVYTVQLAVLCVLCCSVLLCCTLCYYIITILYNCIPVYLAVYCQILMSKFICLN